MALFSILRITTLRIIQVTIQFNQNIQSNAIKIKCLNLKFCLKFKNKIV